MYHSNLVSVLYDFHIHIIISVITVNFSCFVTLQANLLNDYVNMENLSHKYYSIEDQQIISCLTQQEVSNKHQKFYLGLK